MSKNTAKRFLAQFLLIATIFSLIPVFAIAEEQYDYFIEGENYSSTNFASSAGSSVQSRAVCSGKKYLNLYNNPSNDNVYFVEYKIQTDKAGVYKMDIASTPVTTGWSSGISVSINGGEEVKLAGSQFATISGDTQISWYHTNSVFLKEGVNSLKFIVRDRVSSGHYIAFIDCFALTKTEFGLNYVKALAPFGMFQQNEDLSFEIMSKSIVDKDTEFNYEIIDFLGKLVKTGTGIIPKSTNKAEFTISGLKKGHYSILAGAGSSTAFGYFSVVTPLSERKKYEDTPFGVDASPYGIYTNVSKALIDDYVSLIELSGITWIRDRCYFTNAITETEDSYKIKLNAANTYGDKFREKGIRISTTFDSMASNDNRLKKDYSTKMPTDILEAYKFFKALAEQYSGKVAVWEPLNEFDLGGGGSNSDSPDMYSSVFKAWAIGVHDADKKYPVYLTSEPTAGGSRPYASNKFVEMMFENDLFDYADIDNYHSHRSASAPYDVYYSTDAGHYMKEIADGYQQIFSDYNKKPILWNSESGMNLTVPKEIDLSSAQQNVQAKYLVTSSIEAISYGTDKYFYFYGPAYQEGDRQWGMNSRSKVAPSGYTSWTALSAMTYVLGESDYLGFVDIGEDVSCYAFKDGDETAFVIWAKDIDAVGKTVHFDLGVQKAEKYDFFSNKTNVYSVSGGYDIPVTEYPSYLKFAGSAPDGLISNPNGIKISKLGEQKEFTDAQRVILFQKYDDNTRNGVRMGGYNYSEMENKVTLEVTNLNNKPMTGIIKGISDSGWNVYPESQNVVLEPMSSTNLEFTIVPDGFKSLTSKIAFQGDFNGKLTSKSVAYGKAKEVVSALPVIEESGKFLKIFLENTSNVDRVVKKIELNVNGKEDLKEERIELKAKESNEILMPTEFADSDKTLNISMKAYFEDGSICSFDNALTFAVAAKKIDMDKEPNIILPDEGEIKSAYYYGEDDLNAKIWLAADEDNFYFTAKVYDNIFSQPYKGADAWRGDGFQFAIGKGLPAVNAKYAEIGLADTPEGPQVYCWTNQLGGHTGLLEGSKFTAIHSGYYTIYEAEIPWKEIPDMSYDDALMCFSLLINENEGDGRLGYIEWGSGIGSKKEPNKFRTVLFEK